MAVLKPVKCAVSQYNLLIIKHSLLYTAPLLPKAVCQPLPDLVEFQPAELFFVQEAGDLPDTDGVRGELIGGQSAGAQTGLESLLLLLQGRDVLLQLLL